MNYKQVFRVGGLDVMFEVVIRQENLVEFQRFLGIVDVGLGRVLWV